MSLTPQRRQVLEAIAADIWGLSLPTAREISCYCGKGDAQGGWAHGKLFALSKAGLIEFAGYTHGRVMTWNITDAGLAALADDADA